MTSNRLSMRRSARIGGFTLVEVMIATVLTLLLMAAVVQVFAYVGNAASDTRDVLQVIDRLRAVQSTLQTDLANVTAPMLPPLRPESGFGYFEYVEGLQGAATLGSAVSYNIDEGLNYDQTVGDADDVLMFTADSEHGLFYGRTRYIVNTAFGGGTQQQVMDGTLTSQTAEICYFVRGNVLYRRVLLVSPTAGNGGTSTIDPAVFLSSNYNPSNPSQNANTANYDISFYDKFDLSVHQEGGTYDIRVGKTGTRPVLVANSLQDLSRRENRYGHQPWSYPYNTRFWGSPVNPAMAAGGANPGISLGLPTLRECTFYTDLLSGTNAPVARWPFPFYDDNPGALPWAGTANLWGSPQTAVAGLPLIYPSPTGPSATYQTANQHVTTIPASPATNQYLNITLNSLGLTPAPPPFDAWTNANPWDQVDRETGAIYAFSGNNQPNAASGRYDGSTRVGDDVILTNVLSFDVKAWDPTAPIISNNVVDLTNNSNPIVPGSDVYMPGDQGYMQLMKTWASGAANAAAFLATVKQHTVGTGAYVDLNYLASVSSGYLPTDPAPNMYQALTRLSVFSGPGLATHTNGLTSLYDTGSYSYENDGIDQDGQYGPDQLTNGFDDNGVGGVDDLSEVEGSIPYPVPLKGIQVKIRVFEPDSRQIREVTITEDFLWE